jgi:ATPase family AAA domain-containing protein 3A/B
MRKLIFLLTTLLFHATQTNTMYNPQKQAVYAQHVHLTQQVFEPTEDNPIIVSISPKNTEKFIEKVMEKFDERTEGMLENSIENFNDILKESIVPQLKETWQLAFGSLLNSENAIRFGWPIALFGIVSISGLYGAHVCWKLIEKKVLHPRPTILQPGSKYGWLDRWKRSRANYTTPAMIFDESVKERLEEIQEKTKNIRERIRQGKKVTYDNLLLYGKPGTGKTLFAQILADNTDMDFLSVTAASLLQSGIEGIKYFDEIVEMAKNSKYGVILFIDEADALFINRDMLDPESDHYKLLNHILAATGSGSSTMMIIAATNHAHIMDPAMGRRFQDRIKMPLPNEKTRIDLLNLYINQYLLEATDDDFNNLKVRNIFTQERINIIAQQIDGLSHAEIKDMIVIISKKAAATKEGTLNEKHVQSAIDEALEKIAALKKDKLKMKKKRTSTQENQKN